MSRRSFATLVHLLISGAIAAVASLLVFRVWYPPPFAAVAGGLGLFGLIVGIDVVVGPLLTAVVASAAKPLAELRRDIAVIAVFQSLAFGYGILAS